MTTRTKNIMSTKLVTIPIGTPLTQAFELMKRENFRHLPVVDIMNGIVGILSHRDLNYFKNPDHVPVEYVMSSPVVYISQDTPLRVAVQKMLELKISCLLVADDNEDAVGILTTDDLLGYLSSLLAAEPEEKAGLLNVMNLRTVGEIANQLSNAGI